MSNRYTLTPTASRPVVFTGERVAKMTTHTLRGATEFRWLDVAVYRTAGGKYVLEIERVTCWQGERGSTTVSSYDTPEALVTRLEEECPLAVPEIADALGVVREVQ